MTEVFIDTSQSLCFVIYDAVEAVEECITEAERSSEKWKARGGKCDPADDAVIVDIHTRTRALLGELMARGHQWMDFTSDSAIRDTKKVA